MAKDYRSTILPRSYRAYSNKPMIQTSIASPVAAVNPAIALTSHIRGPLGA